MIPEWKQEKYVRSWKTKKYWEKEGKNLFLMDNISSNNKPFKKVIRYLLCSISRMRFQGFCGERIQWSVVGATVSFNWLEPRDDSKSCISKKILFDATILLRNIFVLRHEVWMTFLLLVWCGILKGWRHFSQDFIAKEQHTALDDVGELFWTTFWPTTSSFPLPLLIFHFCPNIKCF